MRFIELSALFLLNLVYACKVADIQYFSNTLKGCIPFYCGKATLMCTHGIASQLQFL